MIDFPDLPQRMRSLKRDDRGYPVPWFIAWRDGVPHFEAMDGQKLVRAINEKACWICGQPLGRFLAFVIGPMCAINRTISEPPSHRECAEFAARRCPFLARPKMGRIPERLHCDDAIEAAGVGLKRNPGVACVWITRSYRLMRVDNGSGILFRLGEPEEILWYAEGRTATRAEVLASIESGLPLLREIAEKQDREEPGAGAIEALDQLVAIGMSLVPA